MSLRVLCPNGHLLELQEQYVGVRVRCPLCAAELTVSAVAMPVPAIPAAIPIHAPPPEPVAPPALLLPDSTTPELAPLASFADPPVATSAPHDPWGEAPAARRDRGSLPQGELTLPFEEEELEVVHPIEEPPPRPPEPRLPSGRPDPEPLRRSRPLLEAEPEELEEFEEYEERGRDRAAARRLRVVRIGLAFGCVKFFFLMVAFAVWGVSVVHGIAKFKPNLMSQTPEEHRIEKLTGTLFRVPLLIVTVTGMVGLMMCCRVPKKTRARTVIVLAATLEGASITLAVLGWILSPFHDYAADAVSLMALALTLISWVLFLLFLSKLAYYLGDDGGADRVMRFMIAQILVTLTAPVGILFLAVLLIKVPTVGVIVASIAIVVVLVLYGALSLGLLTVVNSVRKEIRNRWLS